MQADGFNLEAISKLLEGPGARARRFCASRRALREPFAEERPRVVTARRAGRALRRRHPRATSGDARERARDRIPPPPRRRPFRGAEPAPRCRALRALRARRIPRGRDRGRLDHAQARRRDRQGVRQLFLSEIWEPFDEAGRPPKEWPVVSESSSASARWRARRCARSSAWRWATQSRKRWAASSSECRRMPTMADSRKVTKIETLAETGRRINRDPTLLTIVRSLRAVLPGDGRIADPLELGADRQPKAVGRMLSEISTDRPGVLGEAGLGTLQVWQSISRPRAAAAARPTSRSRSPTSSTSRTGRSRRATRPRSTCSGTSASRSSRPSSRTAAPSSSASATG